MDADGLETWTWTTDDFARRSWHDATLHALAVDPERHELELDLDVVVGWIRGDGDDDPLYDVAPATLVFHDVDDLRVDLRDDGSGLRILRLHRTPLDGGVSGWRLAVASSASDGTITLVSPGFTQFFRHPPRRIGRQQLTRAERGGVSFSRRTPLP